VQGVVLEAEQRLEERFAALDVRQLLHPREAGELVGLEAEQVPLEVLQPVADALRLIDAHAQRPGVDEEADHLLDTGQLGRPARGGGPEEDLLLTAVGAEEAGPRGVREGAEGHAEPGALLLDGGAGGVVEGGREGDLDAAAALVDALAPVHGEPGGGVETAQVGAPEVLVGGRVALAEVSDEVPEGPSRFEGERAALADKGGVAAEDLVEDQAEAPAVEEDVVVAPHEPVRRVA